MRTGSRCRSWQTTASIAASRREGEDVVNVIHLTIRSEDRATIRSPSTNEQAPKLVGKAKNAPVRAENNFAGLNHAAGSQLPLLRSPRFRAKSLVRASNLPRPWPHGTFHRTIELAARAASEADAGLCRKALFYGDGHWVL